MMRLTIHRKPLNLQKPLVSPPSFHRHHPLIVLLLANLLGWWLTRVVVFTNLDGYGDMLENFAWGQGFDWGTHKHPPLQAWVVGVWFRVWPASEAAYWLLAGVNVLVGLCGLAVFARVLNMGKHAQVAVVGLAMLMLPYSTLASKFNANSVLLSVWPWMAVAFWQSVHQQGLRRVVWSVALGVFCALALLGKYYSGVWMLSAGMASLLSPQGRRWWLTPMPWLAALVAGVGLTPHVLWLAHHQWLPLHYVQEQGDGRVNGEQLWRFVASAVIYSALPLLMALVVQWRGAAAGHAPRWASLRALFAPQGAQDVLWWLAVLPLLITLGFGLSGFVELSSPWAIPLVFTFPLLWLRGMQATTVARLAQSFGRWAGLWLLLPVLGLLLVAHNIQSGVDGPTPPRAAAAQHIHQLWQQSHPGIHLKWAGGQWAESALLAFYVDPAIRTVPGTPDDPAARVLNLPADLSRQPGLLLCAMGWVDEPTSEAGRVCALSVQSWLKAQGASAQTLQGQTVHVQRPSNWRFSKPRVYLYKVWMLG